MSKDRLQDKQETSAPDRSHPRHFLSSLKFRIVAVTLGILVATVWVLASQAVSTLRQDMERTLSDQQFATASSIADNIEDGVHSRIDALRSVAEGITPRMLAERALLQRYLAERRAIYRLYNQGIFIISGSGRCQVEQPPLGRVDADFSDIEYFREIMGGAGQAFGKPRISPFAKRPVVVFAVPIRDGNGKIIAVLAGSNRLDGNEVFSRVGGAAHGEDGHAFLISVRDRLFVNTSRPDWVLRPIAKPGVNRMMDRFVAGEDGSGIAVNSEGSEILISGKHVAGTGWLVTVAMPTAEAFAPIHAMERRLYLGAALLSLSFGLLMWLFVRRELQPLEDSVALIRHMSRGAFELRPMPVQGTQEIRELQSSFNQLQERIVAQQETISRESARNALFLSAASDGIHILDEHGCVVEASTTFCRMLGYTHDEIIGLNIAAWEAQCSGERLWQMLAHSLQTPAVCQTRHRRRDGTLLDVEVHSTPFELDGRRMLYATSRDITERKEAEARIHHLAFFDPLTALPNRRLLLDRLAQALAGSRRSNQFGALLFLDLDHFKTLNDTLGHDVGDQFLVQVGERLRASVREMDTVARLGGDEFVVMLESLGKDPAIAAPQAEAVAEKIRSALDQPYTLGKHTHHSSASIGVALFPDNDAGGEEILKRADVALYQAKDAGRNNIRFYSPAMQFALKARADLENSLRHALAAGELHLHYQPQVDRHGHIIGAEALLRWRSPLRGLVMPAEFIALAEECGLILPIGRWVLQTACRQLAEWRRSGHADLVLAVNVSARQFRQPEFVDHVRLELAASGADPSRLKLELTESLVLDNIDEVVATIQALREIGISFVLDDFGTGYSSLSYLKRLPLDQIKIDRSFVRDLATDPDDAEIVRAILAMSRTLRLQVVAEGVETEEQLRFLEQHGCQAYQGYLFSRPVAAADFNALLGKPLKLHQ